jgi:hypothetical protein
MPVQVMGMLFESIKQPVINGYLVAGAIVGPGGLQLIKELVQVRAAAEADSLIYSSASLLQLLLAVGLLRPLWALGPAAVSRQWCRCEKAAPAAAVTISSIYSTTNTL